MDNPKPPKFKAKHFQNSRIDWDDEKWVNLLYKCMRDQKYPKTLLGAILLTMPRANWNSTSDATATQRVSRTIDYILTTTSVELRTRFGVFTDEVSDAKAN